MIDVRPILIMAGGTGGHVFPALAVADELRQRGVPVVWLGTRAGIEARLVPEAGYAIEWMSITGLRGKNAMTLLLAPARLLFACWQAMRVMLRVRPGAVLGMGGFASGPGGLVAWLMRKPLLIQEQNAVPGLTNKVLARLAGVVMQAFPGVFTGALTTGNPVRQAISEIEEPATRMQLDDEPLKLLVIGGSLGAVKLNEIIPRAISKLADDRRPQVVHQTGARNIDEAKQCYAQAGVEADIKAFIDDMSAVYSWADLVICRSGAMTVFELAAAGVASVLVPYPFAVDDHQTANARYLEQAGAAIVRQQDELSEDWVADTIEAFSSDRKRLVEMAIAARRLAIPDSARVIADTCMRSGGLA